MNYSGVYELGQSKGIKQLKENQKRKRHCQCGDPKKLKRLVKHFVQTSTFPGAIHFTSRSKSKCRWFWRIIIITAFIGVIVSLVNLAEEALSRHSVFINTLNRKAQEGPNDEPDFPAYPGITICRLPPYTKESDENLTKIMDYVHLAFNYPFISLTVEERGHLFHPTFDLEGNKKLMKSLVESWKLFNELKKKTPEFLLRDFILKNTLTCEDMFSECIIGMFPTKCCALFSSVLTNLGLCFELQPEEGFKHFMHNSHQAGGFPFIIDLDTAPKTVKQVEEGFIIFVSDPNLVITFWDISDGILVPPGAAASLLLQLKMTNRRALYDTWLEVGTECPVLPLEMESVASQRNRYTRHSCMAKYFNHLIREACNCFPVVDYKYNLQEGIRACEPEDIYKCFLGNAFKENFTKVEGVCKDPCIDYTYTIQSSFGSLGSINASSQKTRVIIKYISDEYIYNEYRKFTISTFFSQIGGSLGLYLGASIITVLELTIFLIQWIWYRFVPSRNSKVRKRKLQVIHPCYQEEFTKEHYF